MNGFSYVRCTALQLARLHATIRTVSWLKNLPGHLLFLNLWICVHLSFPIFSMFTVSDSSANDGVTKQDLF